MPLPYFLERLRAVFTRGRQDRDLTQELDAHASLLEAEHLRRGRSPEEARRLARIELGGQAALLEAHADTRGLPWLENLQRDTFYAFRSLRRDRGFAFFTLLVATLGIGASTAIFSIVNALLLRPLPLHDPSTLVWVAKDSGGIAGDRSNITVPVNPFLEFRQQNRSFSDMAAFFAFYQPDGATLTGSGDPERLTAVPVSDNFFRVLGVTPTLGRALTPEECRANLPVAVLSHAFWKRRFAADPGILGRPLTLNNQLVTVVGVVPFDFGSVLAPGTRVDLFTPLPLTPVVNRMGNTLAMVGRLRPGVTIRQSQAEADVLTGPIGARNDRNGLRFSLRSLDDYVRGSMRPALLLLAGAVGVVMLVLCANISHLQLARSAARRKEMAIRAALGANSGRLILQLLTESLLLFGTAAGLGLLLAFAMTRLVAGLDSIHLPLREAVHLDAVAFAFTGVIAAATVILCGLAPALQLSFGVHDGLKESGRAVSSGRRQGWLRKTLVVTEIAFACVLLIGSGLLLRSLQRVLNVPLGFEPAQTVALRIDPPAATSAAAQNAFIDDLLARIRPLPGISAAGVTDVLPLGGNRSWSVGAKEQNYTQASPPPDAFVRIVSDGYLAALGIPLRSGRDLDARDRANSAPVLLVNESLARALWPGQNPIGKIVKYVGTTDRQVVGVVGDVRHIAMEQSGGNEIYVPMRQSGDYSAVHLVIRSSVAPASALSAVRATLRPLLPNIPVNAHQVLSDVVDQAIAPRRMTTVLLTAFAAFTLILAALGIFGLISYSVSQRSQEIGIRMALGATAAHIRTAILRETFLLASAGIAIGLAASLALSRALVSMLYGIESTDPVTLASVLLLVAAVALLGGYLPARRASRLDPLLTLRTTK